MTVAVWALIPIKSLQNAKTRLAAVLEPDECAMLSQAMLLDILDAAAGAESIDRVAVVTADAALASLVTEAGHTVIPDEADNLCDGLTQAAKYIAAQGATTMVILPSDIPTVQAADIDNIVARHQGNLSICPAIRDGGTNAMLCTPPDAIPFCFGIDSAQRHFDAAEKLELEVQRVPMPAFFRDIDLPEDLAWLVGSECNCNAVNFLHESGISARLNPSSLKVAARPAQ